MQEKYEILDRRIDALSKVLQDMGDRDDNIYRVIFESQPLPEHLRNGAIRKSKLYAQLKEFPEATLISIRCPNWKVLKNVLISSRSRMMNWHK